MSVAPFLLSYVASRENCNAKGAISHIGRLANFLDSQAQAAAYFTGETVAEKSFDDINITTLKAVSGRS